MFAAKPELSQRCISGFFTTGSSDENANNKPSSDMANRISLVVSDTQIGTYITDSNTLKNGLYSQAHIGTQLYQPSANSPITVRTFLQITLSNNNYKSLQHLKTRAENYLRHRKTEHKILRATIEGLTNPESPVFKQTAWMGHLERGLWKTETRWGGNDREQLSKEVLGSEEPKPGSPFYGSRGLKLSDSARSAFSMMLCGSEGPFTKEQALSGFELAQTGQVLAGRLKIQERVKFRADNRIDAQRNGTHSTHTQTGMDLSQDIGTIMRDKAGLPVMSGTSGSSSDAVLATRYAAEYFGKTWTAPGLSQAEGCKAISDLSHHYFRAECSSPPQSMATGINKVRCDAGMEEKHVNILDIFTHSYPEIYAGVALTIAGARGNDEQAMYNVTQEAARLLHEVETKD
ncbi:TPA: secretion protein EspV [Escherichia albertii]|uniref:secretion protein EspV n=1 Tax=Escherichia albertii TaxID=208962 RepID=UPI0009318221|nr:secretion protein EspV [Escherichia albertii]MCZ9120210.1 secretion protein EspV [Escherichia albertii]